MSLVPGTSRHACTLLAQYITWYLFAPATADHLTVASLPDRLTVTVGAAIGVGVAVGVLADVAVCVGVGVCVAAPAGVGVAVQSIEFVSPTAQARAVGVYVGVAVGVGVCVGCRVPVGVAALLGIVTLGTDE